MTWPNLTCLPMLASAYLLTQDPLMSETETNKTNERRRLKWGQGDYKEEEEENFVICDPIWSKSSGSRSDTLRKVTSCSRAVRGISGYKENVTSKFTLKVIKFFNQNFNVPAPGLFYVYFCSFQRQFYWNIVDFSCIRTRKRRRWRRSRWPVDQHNSQSINFLCSNSSWETVIYFGRSKVLSYSPWLSPSDNPIEMINWSVVNLSCNKKYAKTWMRLVN